MDMLDVIANLAIGVGANSINTAAGKLFGRNLDTKHGRDSIEITNSSQEQIAKITKEQSIKLSELFEAEHMAELTTLYIMASMLPDLAAEEIRKIEEDIHLCIDEEKPDDIEPEVVFAYWQNTVSTLQTTVESNKIGHFITQVNDSPQISASIDRDMAAAVKAIETQIPKLRSYLNDSSRVSRTREISDRIRGLAAENYRRPSIDSVLEYSGRTFEQLYIDRQLSFGIEGKRNSAEVFDSSRVIRVVVTGDPGGGKSTLMTHLLIEKVNNSRCREVPIFVKLRNLSHKNRLIVDSIRDAAEAEYQITGISVGDIEDLIISGRALIVFDGLDEIPNVGERREVAEKISRFAVSNQLASVVVTSRKVGYSDAPLDVTKFQHYRLSPYTEDEIAQYSINWFSDKGSLVLKSFLKEVREISDIASNPLMLSLLCSLYKSRGTIPRERRSIYHNCADLLFKRWDATRQIDMAPEAHLDHGDYLMQELAWFFYRFPSAHSGVTGTQLRELIVKYLVDNTATFKGVALRQANEFLDFCAGRAWLLARTGSSPLGESIYEFVHHTFLEYFVAEFVARENWAPDRLAKFIYSEYVKNSSSVVIDLLVSSVNASSRTVIPKLLTEMDFDGSHNGSLDHSKIVALKLRVISSVTTSTNVVDGVLCEALNQLTVSNSGRDVFLALINLPLNLADRLVGLLCDSSEVRYDSLSRTTAELRVVFVELFKFHIEFVPEFDCDESWTARLDSISKMIRVDERLKSRALRWWARGEGDSGYLCKEDIALVLTLFGGAVSVAGPVSDALNNVLDGEPASDIDLVVLEAFESDFKPIRFPASEFELAEKELWRILERVPGLEASRLSVPVRNLLGCLLLIGCELDFERVCDIVDTDYFVGVNVKELYELRRGASISFLVDDMASDELEPDWRRVESPLDYPFHETGSAEYVIDEGYQSVVDDGSFGSLGDLCRSWSARLISLVE
ncbi:NACHT domain-containing protein [Brevibacterium linens]|uniref:NACHT domain-containing protein n=1 Tax=Brevibacterium linens TaxID=1703 RepID=A0A2H1JRN9_BRELN|nr:NACHT domain-containing protein [Brevibacterium linens]SMX90004.1 NACHT domain-containing protein [Brevibacterium linens]